MLQASLEPSKKSELAIDIVFYMQLEISKLLRALYEYMRWGVKGKSHVRSGGLSILKIIVSQVPHILKQIFATIRLGRYGRTACKKYNLS